MRRHKHRGASGTGVRFTGSSQSYYGAVASGAVATARVRFRLDAMPTTGFRLIAGSNDKSDGTGWLVCTEDVVGSALVGQLVVYVGKSSVRTQIARKFFMPDDVGKIFTVHIVCTGGLVWAYLDGKKINAQISCASITTAAGPMHIGGKTDGSASSFVTVLDVAEGTTALTPAQVATDVAALTPAFAGQTHRYVATQGLAATWSDQVGTANLARVGSPTVQSFTPTFGQHRGAIEIWGDSIVAGIENTGPGGGYVPSQGWRRAFQRSLSAAGKPVTLLGANDNEPAATYYTLDFDFLEAGFGGYALGGTSPNGLDLLTSGLNLYSPDDSISILAFGTNDFTIRSRTTAQMQADVATACGLINAARPGRPIFVCNVIDAGGTTSAPIRTEINTYQAAFASMITTLRATYPLVVGVDYSAAVSNPDDTAQLYDGIHPTPATHAAIAAIVAPIVAAHI